MARVLVTGVTGFIASRLAASLIDAGHTVRGTARNPEKAKRVREGLRASSGRPAALEIVPADLASDHGWRAAADGCDFVHHVASPLPVKLPRDPDALVPAAREGTLRVLRAAKAAGARRVVMTSSIATIAYGVVSALPAVFTENDWSDPDVRSDNTAYTRSKILAERAAWAFAEEAGLALSTIHPVAVVGPVMGADYSASIETVAQLLGGRVPAVPDLGFQLVDVRDVADLHIRAMTDPAATGERFIAASDFLWFPELAAYLREALPDYADRIPTGRLPSWLVRGLAPFNPVLGQIRHELGKKRVASSRKAETVLAWRPRAARKAALATAESMIAMQLV